MNAMAALSPSSRSTVRRHRERGRTDRSELFAVLDAGLVCHLGVIIDGSPAVIPTGYGRIGETFYLHGSSANRALLAADGQDVCVTVTLLDGLVYARALMHHSMNYRSAVIYGTAALVTEKAAKLAALRAVTEQLAPGQWDYARSPTRKELAATAVVSLPLHEASVKVRTGPPKDDDEDYATAIWAGVLPAALTFGPPQPDPRLNEGIGVPSHISELAWRARGAASFG